jgi:hypothetical protein
VARLLARSRSASHRWNPVKAHRRTDYHKLGTASRTETVAQAERQGLHPCTELIDAAARSPTGNNT